MRKTLGQLIRAAREDKGMTIRDCAKQLGMSRMTLSRLEENHTQLISVFHLIAISNVLEMDILRLLRATGKNVRKSDIELLIGFPKKIFMRGKVLDKKKVLQLLDHHFDSLVEDSESSRFLSILSFRKENHTFKK